MQKHHQGDHTEAQRDDLRQHTLRPLKGKQLLDIHISV